MSSTAESTHASAQLLLPWLLAGTLEGAELAMVRRHLQTCPACQADLARERRLRDAGQREPALDPDRALARLLPRLQPRQPRAGLAERWRNAVAANDTFWLRALSGAQFAAIAVLALLLARPAEDAGSYRALGASASAQGTLVVTFRPDTPERELRRILQDSGARVVDGPTVTGAYVLAVPATGASQAAARLRTEAAVTLAQPLTPGSTP